MKSVMHNVTRSVQRNIRDSWSRSWITQYKAVYEAMTTKPSSEDASIQNKVLKALVDGGYYAKAEVIDIFSVPTADASLINWRAPGTFNPTLINAPLFTAYEGYTGDNAKLGMLSSEFNPAADGSIINKDNICIIAGIGNETTENLYAFGGYDGTNFIYLNPQSSGGTYVTYFNESAGNGGASALLKGHFAISRTTAGQYTKYANKTKVVVNQAATALLNKDIGICGAIREGLASVASNKQIRYFMVLSGLADEEVYDVMDIMEDYYA